jgi:hypothetical protein
LLTLQGGDFASGSQVCRRCCPSLSHIQVFGQMNLKRHAGLYGVRDTKLVAEPGLEAVISLNHFPLISYKIKLT